MEKSQPEIKVSHVYSLRESQNKAQYSDLTKSLDFFLVSGKFVKIQLLNQNYELLVIEESLKQETKLVPSQLQNPNDCIQLLMINIKQQFYVLRVCSNGQVEIIDFQKQSTIVKDFSKLFKNFRMSVVEKTLYIFNQDNQSQVGILTGKKIMHILQDEKVKINVVDFSSLFTSISKILTFKLTNQNGESKLVMYGIGSSESFFKASIVLQQEKQKFGYIFNMFKQSIKRKLKGNEQFLEIQQLSIDLKEHIKRCYKEETRNFQDFIFIPKQSEVETIQEMQKIPQYLVIQDKNSRVYLLDQKSFILLKVWKGYRDTTIGLIKLSNMNYQLMIFLPKRNLLEGYLVEKKFRYKEALAIDKKLKLQMKYYDNECYFITEDMNVFKIHT